MFDLPHPPLFCLDATEMTSARRYIRKHHRYAARLPLSLRTLADRRRSSTYRGSAVTRDISLSGIFVLCAPSRSVEVGVEIELDVTLPDTLEEVRLRGRVVRVSGEGFGVEIFSSSAFCARWFSFVHSIAYEDPHDYPVQHHSNGKLVEHIFAPKSLDELYEFQEMDIFLGGNFIRTHAYIAQRSMMRVIFIHPCDGTRHKLWAVVTRSYGLPHRGVTLRFVGDPAELSAALRAFIERGLPSVELEHLLVQTPTSLGKKGASFRLRAPLASPRG